MRPNFNTTSYSSVLQEKRHDQNTIVMNLVNTEQFGKLIWNSYMFKCYCAKKNLKWNSHCCPGATFSSIARFLEHKFNELIPPTSFCAKDKWLTSEHDIPSSKHRCKNSWIQKKNHSIVECLLVLCLLPFVSYDSLNANHKDDSLPLCLLWLILQLIPSPHQLMEFSHEKKLPNQFSSRDVGKKRNGTTSKS